MSKTNCINCGAAKDTAEIRCPFCGTTYLDLTAIDFSSDAPVVCQFVLPETYQIQGIEGKLVMSMMAIPKLEEMREETEDIVMEEQKDEKLESATEETMAEKTEEPTSDEPKEDEKMAEPTEEEPKDEPKDEGGVKASEEEVKAGCGEDEKLGCGEKMEDDESDDDDNEDKDEDDDEDHNEKMAELEAKLAETEAKLSAKDETITKMQEQIDELVKFKTEKEETEKMSIVTATLAQVKDCMAEADYAKFEESGKTCKLENITAWKNEVLANVATILMSEKEKEDDGITRMSLPTEPEKPKGLWG